MDVPSTVTRATSGSKYDELKMHGPPLYNQGLLPAQSDSFKTKELTANSNLKALLPLDASRTALLVVDVQPEYWTQCPAVRQDFPEFPSRLAHVLKTCRERRAKIIWIRADYRYSHSPWLLQFSRLHNGKIPPEVLSSPQTSTWEDFAIPLGGEFVIPKTSWSSTSHTNLVDLLHQSGIDTVLVCGLITSVCVQHSAFGIFEAGHRTILVTDACADRGRARHEAALALYGDYMYELMSAQQVHEELRAAQPVWLTNTSKFANRSDSSLNQLQVSITQNWVTKDEVKCDEETNSRSSSVTHSVSTLEDDEFSR
jgi:nicotinamidase-related amidase